MYVCKKTHHFILHATSVKQSFSVARDLYMSEVGTAKCIMQIKFILLSR